MRRYNWKQIVTRSSPYTFAFLDVRNIMPHARCFLGQYLQIINQYSEKNANCLGEEGRQSITHYPIGCFHPPVHERRQFLQMHKLYRVVNQSIVYILTSLVERRDFSWISEMECHPVNIDMRCMPRVNIYASSTNLHPCTDIASLYKTANHFSFVRFCFC